MSVPARFRIDNRMSYAFDTIGFERHCLLRLHNSHMQQNRIPA